MAYHIIETPDHLHRGLHLFAAHNLRNLLRWISAAKCTELTLKKISFDREQSWFLEDIVANVRPRTPQARWLARKEAQAFFKKYPEFRERKSYRLSDFGASKLEESVTDVRMLEQEEEEEYQEYEAREDEMFSDAVPVREAVSEVKRALNTQRIEVICDSMASLIDILYEHAEPPTILIEGLEAIYELLTTGARADTRLLVSSEDEAFEVTELCRGAFRKTATGGIPVLYKIPPREFENFVGELLAQHGLTGVHTTPAVADDGADIIAYRFQDGKRLKYIIQCKRFACDNRVSVGVVRELVGVKMDLNATHALLVTTSEFTKPAREFAHRGRSKVWGVRLINYKVLQKLLELTD